MEELADRPVLAIDFGGTQIRAALITPDLAVHARRAVPTNDEEGADAVVGRICEIAVEVLDAGRVAALPPAIGVGISGPGPLDPWRGVVLSPPNLPALRDVGVATAVADAVGLPTFLERDTNVAVGAEWLHGAARGAGTAVYVTVSTGVGGGVIVDGRPLIGPDGAAGEAGHLVVDLDGPICGCGGQGHVEAIASGTALAREARSILERGASPRLRDLARDGAEVDARLLARAADEGDAACAAVLERAWAAIGALCVSLVNLLNPDVIVVGGSIAEHRPDLLDVARSAVARDAFAVPASRVRIVPSMLGDDVSLIGCLPLVTQRLADPAFRPASGRPMMATTPDRGAPNP